MTDHTGFEATEKGWIDRLLEAALRRVVRIVQADADDLSGVGEDGQIHYFRRIDQLACGKCYDGARDGLRATGEQRFQFAGR